MNVDFWEMKDLIATSGFGFSFDTSITSTDENDAWVEIRLN